MQSDICYRLRTQEDSEMKLTHIKNVDEFFKVVDSCKGRVELVTGEGDRRNL